MKIEHLITIKRDPAKKKRRQRWPVDPSDRSRLLARRRQNRFLNVYDLGQYANGTDTNLHTWNRQIVLPYTVLYTGAGRTLRISATFDPPGVDNLANRTATWNDDYLALDVESWPDTFKDITEDLDDYDISIDGFNRYVSGKGLVSDTNIETIAVVPGTDTSLLRDQWFYKTRNHYFTSDPEPGADEVEFTFDKTCDLFLVPVVYYGTTYAARYTGAPISTTLYAYQSFIVQKQLPRESALGNADWNTFWPNRTDEAGRSAGERALLRSMFIDDPDAEAWRMRAEPGETGSLPIDADNPLFTPFPTQAAFSWTIAPLFESLENVGPPAQRLVAVIRKRPDEWFYMWTDDFWQIPDSVHSFDLEI